MRVYEGRILFWQQHQRRLGSALEVLGLSLPCPWEELHARLQTLSQGTCHGRLKLIAMREGHGTYTPNTHRAELWLSIQLLEGRADYPWGPSQRLTLYPYPLLGQTPWSAYKTLSALSYVQAARFAQERGFSDAILLSTAGHMAETSRANLFWWDRETLYTPPLSTGAIAGVLRGLVLTQAEALGLPTKQIQASPEVLCHAHEVFTTNVIQGIAPVETLVLSDCRYHYEHDAISLQLSQRLRSRFLLTETSSPSK